MCQCYLTPTQQHIFLQMARHLNFSHLPEWQQSISASAFIDMFDRFGKERENDQKDLTVQYMGCKKQ